MAVRTFLVEGVSPRSPATRGAAGLIRTAGPPRIEPVQGAWVPGRGESAAKLQTYGSTSARAVQALTIVCHAGLPGDSKMFSSVGRTTSNVPTFAFMLLERTPRPAHTCVHGHQGYGAVAAPNHRLESNLSSVWAERADALVRVAEEAPHVQSLKRCSNAVEKRYEAGLEGSDVLGIRTVLNQQNEHLEMFQCGEVFKLLLGQSRAAQSNTFQVHHSADVAEDVVRGMRITLNNNTLHGGGESEEELAQAVQTSLRRQIELDGDRFHERAGLFRQFSEHTGYSCDVLTLRCLQMRLIAGENHALLVVWSTQGVNEAMKVSTTSLWIQQIQGIAGWRGFLSPGSERSAGCDPGFQERTCIAPQLKEWTALCLFARRVFWGAGDGDLAGVWRWILA
ncbi:hypothetical protein M427DRAFT_42105 [Gonapodya prolifera JEL478]|uniref:Uncharacterized protein n=1 Tax=Gonapodya prolifera (strain JEL478) TaxID=1344416 RepID=A0A139AQM1_GONPJ|nr:hypothetical protein M427DRAFT_42105 [Gonapodya prolifera JEL478]|eukprot:KXS18785.1 hypothetical protein M427DRAFT_42105 [Gonapodya prolifera JEL478]